MSAAIQVSEPANGQHEDRADVDPLAEEINYAVHNLGWALGLQLDFAVCVNALTRVDGSFIDVVTIPPTGAGDSTVVRLQCGPSRVQPRQTGPEWWCHRVPVEVALRWVLSAPQDDELLTRWQRNHAGGDPF